MSFVIVQGIYQLRRFRFYDRVCRTVHRPWLIIRHLSSFLILTYPVPIMTLHDLTSTVTNHVFEA